MSIKIERGPLGKGIQTIRAVVDSLQGCNLRCKYCHPGETWGKAVLPAQIIEGVFQTVEDNSLLEITLTGGEPTLHPDLQRILDVTHILDKTVATLITNATNITPQLVTWLRESNIGRICVSIDGPDAKTHDSARGNTFKQAFTGLCQLQETGKPITVISVAHHENYKDLLHLSELLAQQKLATQHHLCAPSYSGEAKTNWDRFHLHESEFYELQAMVDEHFDTLERQGLYVTFNSFWPATGKHPQSSRTREITLSQLIEQVKNTYVIIRPNGDLRLTAASWGRETVGNAVVGNLHQQSAGVLFDKANQLYRQGNVRQLPREVEAHHKFHVEDEGKESTNRILDNKEQGPQNVQMIPIEPLSKSEVLQLPLSDKQKGDIKRALEQNPQRYRIIQNPSGPCILFDKTTQHVTLLTNEEVKGII